MTPTRTSYRMPTKDDADLYSCVQAFNSTLSRWMDICFENVRNLPLEFTHWMPMPPAPVEEWEEAWKAFEPTNGYATWKDHFKAGFEAGEKSREAKVERSNTVKFAKDRLTDIANKLDHSAFFSTGEQIAAIARSL